MRILLSTINSTYQHTAFGLRYLYANMQDLQTETGILEFTLQKSPQDIAEAILSEHPQILGLGVYIWNTRQSLDLVRILKKLAPEMVIVLGGPEVSYETESQEICQLADYVIQGEGDFAFRELCSKILGINSQDLQSSTPIIESRYSRPALPNIREIRLPYEFYTDDDIRNRYVYVEASRGCPYKCEYCLSSLDKSVRSFDLDILLAEFQTLIERGARQFKFIDRTFNLNTQFCTRILNFFLEKIESEKLELFLHFEMVPDRLPDEIKSIITRFPAGSLQFEIGIQTFNPEVARNVSRRNDYQKLAENLQFLKLQTKVHTHADLIVGLPGEDLESFAKGFDRLLELGPDEIQVGILKRLKGTPIIRHDNHFKMKYQDHPPFQVLSTKDVSFSEIQKMARFAKHWDWYANSGQFTHSMLYLQDQVKKLDTHSSFFAWFSQLSQAISAKFPQSHGVSLLNQVEVLWNLIRTFHPDWQEAFREVLIHDYSTVGRRDIPGFLRLNSANSLHLESSSQGAKKRSSTHNQRQQRRDQESLGT